MTNDQEMFIGHWDLAIQMDFTKEKTMSFGLRLKRIHRAHYQGRGVTGSTADF
jgi:hypothetical protein